MYLVFVTNQMFVFVAYVLFIKHDVDKKLNSQCTVHVVGEIWDPITSIT